MLMRKVIPAFVLTWLVWVATVVWAVDTTNTLAGYNTDNVPTVTLGTASLRGFGCGNNNGVQVAGAATGSAPAISVIASSVCSGSDTNQNLSVAGLGTGIVQLGQALCTASGATPQTCNGQRGLVTTNSLSTAATTDATFQINDNSVTAASMIQCTLDTYSGTMVTNGIPVVTLCVPASGNITVHITNVGANAMGGTVGIAFVVMN